MLKLPPNFKLGLCRFSNNMPVQTVDVFIHKILNNQHVSTNFNLKFIMLQILLLLLKSANNEYISCYRKETLFAFFLVKNDIHSSLRHFTNKTKVRFLLYKKEKFTN